MAAKTARKASSDHSLASTALVTARTPRHAAAGSVAASRQDSEAVVPQQQAARHLKVDLSGCKYELLRHVASRLHWQLVPAGAADWDLCWLDTSISQERLLRLEPTQRINHFYGMLELARKRPMARTVGALALAAAAATSSTPSTSSPAATAAPNHTAAAAAAAEAGGVGSGNSGPVPSLLLDFMSQTWLLPQQLPAFLAAAQAGGRKASFIVKPDAGCQGRGIRLVMGGPEPQVLQALGGAAAVEAQPAVAQQYITNPLLVNGLKIDLRVYCLVTSVEPLRVFLYKEGLVRFCTTPYKRPTSKNLACSFMHLTNYAVNKHNTAAFIAPVTAAAVAPGVHQDSSWADSRSTCRGSSDGSDGCCGQACGQQQEEEDGGGSGSCCCSQEDASKWSFQQLRHHLESQGADWPLLWSRISQLVTKSLIAVTPHLAASYKTCVLHNTPTSITQATYDRVGSNGGSSSNSTGGGAGTRNRCISGTSCATPAMGRNSSGSSRQPAGLHRCSSSSSDGAGAAVGVAGGAGGGRSRRQQKAASPAALAAAHGCHCFEVLGVDVLIDQHHKPWLVEVNHSPSFNIDSLLDRTIKESLIVDTIKLVRLDPKAVAAAKRASHKATQARLLTSTHCRQGCVFSSSSSATSGSGISGSSGGCSAAVQQEAQQEERAALISNIDSWQSKHLGGFERAYPLHLPGSPSSNLPTSNMCSSSSSASISRGSSREAQLAAMQQRQQQWLQYATQQQELYDQLLLLSHKVYLNQQQQKVLRSSPPKQRQQHSSAAKQQQQRQHQHDSSRQDLCRSLSQPATQQQQQKLQGQQQMRLQKCSTSPSRLRATLQPSSPEKKQPQSDNCHVDTLLSPSSQQQQQQQQPPGICSKKKNSSSSNSSNSGDETHQPQSHLPTLHLAAAAAATAPGAATAAARDSARGTGPASMGACSSGGRVAAAAADGTVAAAPGRPLSSHKADSALAALRAVLSGDWRDTVWHQQQLGLHCSNSSSSRSAATGGKEPTDSSSSSSSSHPAKGSSRPSSSRPSGNGNRQFCQSVINSRQVLEGCCPPQLDTQPLLAAAGYAGCGSSREMTGSSSNSSSSMAGSLGPYCQSSTSSGGGSGGSNVSEPSSQRSLGHDSNSTGSILTSSNIESVGSHTDCSSSCIHAAAGGRSSSNRGQLGAHAGTLAVVAKAAATVAGAPHRLSSTRQVEGRQLLRNSTWPASSTLSCARQARPLVNAGSTVAAGNVHENPLYSKCAAGKAVIGSRQTATTAGRFRVLPLGGGGDVVVSGSGMAMAGQLHLVGAALGHQQRQQWHPYHPETSQRCEMIDAGRALCQQQQQQLDSSQCGSSGGLVANSDAVSGRTPPNSQEGQCLPQLGRSARLLQRINITGGCWVG